MMSKSVMEMPGPGNYDDDSKTFGKNGMAASIRGKRSDEKPSGHPGPGAYE